MNFLKKQSFIFKGAAIIIGVHLLYFLIIVSSNMIPHRLMEYNLAKSAEQLTQQGLFVSPLNINDTAIKWDNLTTAISFNIIWNTDNIHPVQGALLNPVGTAIGGGQYY